MRTLKFTAQMEIGVGNTMIISTECIVSNEDEARDEGMATNQLIKAFLDGYGTEDND